MSSEQPQPRSPADLRSELFTEADRIMQPEAHVVRSDIAAHEAARDIAMHVVRQKRAHDAALAAASRHVSSELVSQSYPPAARQEHQVGRAHMPRKKAIGIVAAATVLGLGGFIAFQQRGESPVGAESSAPRGVAEAIMGNIVDVEAAGMDALGPQSCNEPGAEIATVVLESVRVPLIYELEPTKKQKGAADWTFAVNRDNTSEGYVAYTESHYPEVKLDKVLVGIFACEKEGTPELAVAQEGDRIEVNAADIDFRAKLSYDGVLPTGSSASDRSVVLYPSETELKENPGYTDQSVKKANEIHGALKADDDDIPDQAYGAINEAVKTVFADMVSDEAENVRLPVGTGSFLEALRLAIKTRVSGGEITPAQVDVSGTIADVTPVLDDKELRGIVTDPSILPLDPPIEELVLVDKVAVVLGASAPEDTERS